MCEYCENVNKIKIVTLMYEVNVKRYDKSFGIGTIEDSKVSYESVCKPNYCPACGRKLGE